MSSTRILVTAAGGALAPLNIRLMKESVRHSVWVMGVDTNPTAAGRYFADEFATVPAGDSSEYSHAIGKLVAEFDIDLVLPWSDEEALNLSENRQIIEHAGAVLACTSHDTLVMMNDKAKSFEVLGAAGVSVPKWTLAKSKDELKEAIQAYRDDLTEFVVKPVVARGNRGTYVIREDVRGVSNFLGSRELHMDFNTFMAEHLQGTQSTLPVMVMERLLAPAYDIDVLARGGKLLRSMPRERLNPAGVPFTGGILRPTEELISLATEVTAALKLDWLYDYDLMTGRNGKPVVIEINPRPSGSIAAAILAGVPFYEDVISLLKGEELPEILSIPVTAVIPHLDCTIVPMEALP